MPTPPHCAHAELRLRVSPLLFGRYAPPGLRCARWIAALHVRGAGRRRGERCERRCLL